MLTTNKIRFSFDSLEKYMTLPADVGASAGIGCAFWPTKSYRKIMPKQPIQTLDTDINRLQLSRLLGSGGFGSVYEGRFKNTRVAVKKLHSNTKNPRAIDESFVAETAIRYIKHKNIVRLIAVSSFDSSETKERFIVMEYVGERNLQHIIDSETEKIGIRRRTRYATDVCNALSHIHSQGIAHLDVKPANILVTSHDTCKLGDFGCCKLIPEDGECSPTTPTNSMLTGTFAFRAPELLKGEHPTGKADVYSLGICLWQLMTRDRPFGVENLYVVVFGVVAYNMRPMITAEQRTKHKSYVQLIENLWQGDPQKRPSAYDVLQKLKKPRFDLRPRASTWR